MEKLTIAPRSRWDFWSSRLMSLSQGLCGRLGEGLRAVYCGSFRHSKTVFKNSEMRVAATFQCSTDSSCPFNITLSPVYFSARLPLYGALAPSRSASCDYASRPASSLPPLCLPTLPAFQSLAQLVFAIFGHLDRHKTRQPTPAKQRSVVTTSANLSGTSPIDS